MTAMLLALVFSEAALNASEANEYRVVVVEKESGEAAEPYVEHRSSGGNWRPGVKGWASEKQECPAIFHREIAGFGIVRVGPRCTDEEMPYAL
jgi:hypothetical protein